MIRSDSPILRIGVKVISPLALLVATYLFFAGHNQPGGGFSAGLVMGAVVVLRTVTGLQKSSQVTKLLAIGTIIAACVGVVPVFFGEPMLTQSIWETSLPLLGKVKFGSALIFDFGVTLVVVGMVTAAIEGLGGTQYMSFDGEDL